MNRVMNFFDSLFIINFSTKVLKNCTYLLVYEYKKHYKKNLNVKILDSISI